MPKEDERKGSVNLFPTIDSSHWKKMFANHRNYKNPITEQIKAMSKLKFNYLDTDGLSKPVVIILAENDKNLGTLEQSVDGYFYYNCPRGGYFDTSMTSNSLRQIASELDKLNGSHFVMNVQKWIQDTIRAKGVPFDEALPSH